MATQQRTQTRRRGPSEGFDVTAGWINYNARDHLLYLALTGRLRLDWAWLLGVGVIKPWRIADQLQLPFTAQLDQLRQQVLTLGHNPDSSTSHACKTACASRNSSSPTPPNAAGPVKSSDTAAPPTAYGHCSRNSTVRTKPPPHESALTSSP
jgi:hypothetical protein